MTPREIIAKAWVITKKEKGLRGWGFATAMLETLLSLKLIIYQMWFFWSYVQGEPIGFFTIEAVLYEHLPLWAFTSLTVFFLLLVATELVFPHLAAGAIIGLGAKSYLHEEVKGGFVLGLYNFFPLFAIREIFVLSGINILVTGISLILRYATGLEVFGITVLLFLWAFSSFFKFLSIFAEEAVVISKDSFGTALGKSFKMVISHLTHIVFLMLLLFIIALRIVANAAMFFLVPAIVVGISYGLALLLPTAVSYTIGGTVGLILIGVASYFFAYLHVFRQTAWTITYIELQKQKDLDIIEGV